MKLNKDKVKDLLDNLKNVQYALSQMHSPHASKILDAMDWMNWACKVIDKDFPQEKLAEYYHTDCDYII